jgi:hypothetical protein
MKFRLAFFFAAAILSGSLVAFAQAGTVHGVVTNRTLNKPAADIEVTLINLQQGMTPIATTRSDAQGQFTFDNPAIGAGPMLLRASYQGVTFNTPLFPGKPAVDLEIYDLTNDPKSLNVVGHVVIFEPSNGKLVGAEEYNVQNSTSPPKAFFRADGSFLFPLPEKATMQQVTAIASSTGMPVPQVVIDKTKDTKAIAYSFRPGETNIRLSYELPYSNSSTVKIPIAYPNMKLILVAPPGVTLSAPGLQPAGQDQGMMIYAHEPMPAKSSLAVTVSGVGTIPAEQAPQGDAAPDPQMPQQGNSRMPAPQSSQSADVQAVPSRLDSLKWPLIGVFVVLFAFCGFLLSRKQIIVAPAAATSTPAPVIGSAPIPPTPSAEKPAPAGSVAAISQQVNSSLDSLKDSLFRLELRRQAGTISEEDYARERSQFEKLLRDLVGS